MTVPRWRFKGNGGDELEVRMDVWKQASYLGMIGLLAISVSNLFAQGAGDAAKGKTVFETNCSICHEAESETTKVGPGLKDWSKKPPHDFNGKQHTHNEETLREQVKNGSSAMPPMGSLVSDAELNDLVAYVLSL